MYVLSIYIKSLLQLILAIFQNSHLTIFQNFKRTSMSFTFNSYETFSIKFKLEDCSDQYVSLVIPTDNSYKFTHRYLEWIGNHHRFLDNLQTSSHFMWDPNIYEWKYTYVCILWAQNGIKKNKRRLLDGEIRKIKTELLVITVTYFCFMK